MKTKLVLLINLIIATVTFSQVPTLDLIKEYTFTNGSLSNTINSGVYDLTTITSPATYTKTLDPLLQTDAALSLKGNELSGGEHPTTAIIDADFSVSFWIKTTNNSATESSIFNQVGKIAGSSLAFAGIRAYLQNGALSFGGHYRLGSGTYYSETKVTSSTINDGDWHHIVITGNFNRRLHPNSNTLKLIRYDYSIYIDNVLDASGSTTEGFDYDADAYLFEGTPDLIIGSAGFQGDLDNFRVYTRSLDVGDINNLYKELKQTYVITTTAINGTIAIDIASTNGTYVDGTVVALTATPDTGYQFDGWSGDLLGTTNPESITMDVNKSITALFSPIQQILTTTAVNGSISVDVSPINGSYDYGTVVLLTATPDVGYQFNGWSGDLSGTTNPESITMDANKSVTAMFSVDPTASIVDNEFNNAVKIYPNPVQSTIHINLAAGETLENVQVFNVLGKKVTEVNTLSIDFGNLTSGIYILKIENSQGKVAVRKIVKK